MSRWICSFPTPTTEYQQYFNNSVRHFSSFFARILTPYQVSYSSNGTQGVFVCSTILSDRQNLFQRSQLLQVFKVVSIFLVNWAVSAEKSSYRFLESQINLVCLLHDIGIRKMGRPHTAFKGNAIAVASLGVKPGRQSTGLMMPYS